MKKERGEFMLRVRSELMKDNGLKKEFISEANEMPLSMYLEALDPDFELRERL